MKIRTILGALIMLVSGQVGTAIINSTATGNIGTSGNSPVPDHIIGLGFVNTGGSDYHRDILEYDISGLGSGDQIPESVTS